MMRSSSPSFKMSGRRAPLYRLLTRRTIRRKASASLGGSGLIQILYHIGDVGPTRARLTRRRSS